MDRPKRRLPLQGALYFGWTSVKRFRLLGWPGRAAQHQMQAEAAIIGTQAFSHHGARLVDRAAIPQCRQGGDRLEQILFAHDAAAQKLSSLGNDQSRRYRLGSLTVLRFSGFFRGLGFGHDAGRRPIGFELFRIQGPLLSFAISCCLQGPLFHRTFAITPGCDRQ